MRSIRLAIFVALLALPAFAQFGSNATSLRGKRLCNPLTVADGEVLTYDAALNCFKAAAGGGLSGLTTNTVPKAASASTIADSAITDDGTTVTIGSRTVTINNSANSAGKLILGNTTASRSFEMTNGNWNTTNVVAYFRPTTSNTRLAWDIMPNGNAAESHMDVCANDIVADQANWECLELSSGTSTGYASVSAKKMVGGSESGIPLFLNTRGGDIAMGGGGITDPNTSLHIYGGNYNDHMGIWLQGRDQQYMLGVSTTDDDAFAPDRNFWLYDATGTRVVMQAKETVQIMPNTADPGCTSTAHIGKIWFDTTTTTTVEKRCVNVAGTVGWQSAAPVVPRCSAWGVATGDTLATDTASRRGVASTDIGTTETAFAKTCVIPANTFAAGTYVQFRTLVAQTATGSQTFQYKVRLTNASGTEVIVASAAAPPSSITDRPVPINWGCWGTAAAGASVNISCNQEIQTSTPAGGGVNGWGSAANTSAANTAVAATNADITFVLTVTFSAATDGNAAQLLAMKAFVWP